MTVGDKLTAEVADRLGEVASLLGEILARLPEPPVEAGPDPGGRVEVRGVAAPVVVPRTPPTPPGTAEPAGKTSPVKETPGRKAASARPRRKK